MRRKIFARIASRINGEGDMLSVLTAFITPRKPEEFSAFVIRRGTCDVCDKEAIVIVANTAPGEYGDAAICMECIRESVQYFKKEERTMKAKGKGRTQ